MFRVSHIRPSFDARSELGGVGIVHDRTTQRTSVSTACQAHLRRITTCCALIDSCQRSRPSSCLHDDKSELIC